MDETDTENLQIIDSDFPLFGLGALLISQAQYTKLSTGIEIVKAKYFSSPETFVIHSAELSRPNNKKSDPRNTAILDPGVREWFYSDLDLLLSKTKFKVVTYFVAKNKSTRDKFYAKNLYFAAFEYTLNRILKYGGQKNKILIEKRNKHLNIALLQEYKRLCTVGSSKYKAENISRKTSFEMKSKSDNINGLQIIDLILYVLARKYLGKKEKPPGNNLSLKLTESKIIEQIFLK
jgi:hypothetical protein